MPVYSEAQFALTSMRNGQDRSRLGAAGATGILTGYENESFSVIVPLTFRRAIPGTTSYLTFSLVGVAADEQPNLVEEDGTIYVAQVGYQNFFAPDAMYGVSLTYRNLSLESSAITIDRESLELRFDYARILSEHWGVHTRALYSTGPSEVDVLGTPVNWSQPDDRVYVEANFVGTYASDDLGFVPQGWTFHPTLGLNYQVAMLEEVLNSVGGIEAADTEIDGSVVALARFDRGGPPGTCEPYFELGAEHILWDSNALYSDESDYLIGGVGATMISQGGNVFTVGLQQRRGFQGERISTDLVLGANFAF